MFSKILIANRGEIACRVIRTARRLGIATVAVYSDADADALHVAEADEAYRVGPAPVAESYLNADALLEAAARAGAEAVHPGYGFLSENPDFVARVTESGLRFIGPPADAIRAMGLKDAAKALMEDAGVPVVPGYHGAEQAVDFLRGEADAIGYPVLIKARAGGGGKGMRRVDNDTEFAAALEGAQREAAASFGDDRVLVEKYVAKPRHIEIQVFADDHANAVHLFERDCSLQRRHQKVIEEAPAPGMTPEMRAAMGEASVKAAKAIGYSGAGTVEFIVDASDGLRPDRFYFMEMNTRLQVEHPVTEAITGLDLVEWQLRVASGEALPLSQDDLAIDGWAFEARLYAEDAANDFLPATGTLSALTFPTSEAIRVDTGVRAGDEITPFYDPMIAKVIVHGPTRTAALGALRRALETTTVAGTTTNIGFLRRLAADPGFGAGDVDTGLIARNFEALTAPTTPTAEAIAIAALAAGGLLARFVRPPRSTDPWDTLPAFRINGDESRSVVIDFEDTAYDVRLSATSDGSAACSWADNDIRFVSLTATESADEIRWRTEGTAGRVRVVADGRHILIEDQGRAFAFRRPLQSATEDEAGATGDTVLAPMPGIVRSVEVQVGDRVDQDAALVVLEAMKMEHTLRAPHDGRVSEVAVRVGEQVALGAALVVVPSSED